MPDRATPASPPATEAKPSPKGLEVLRRLCAFHADVVHEIQSNKIEFEPGDEKLEAEVRAPVDWYRLSRGEAAILRQDLPDKFVTTAEARTTFCGPLHLISRRKRGRESLVWLPIFLLHTKTRREPDRIVFELDGEVQLNMAWLEELFAGEDEELRDDLMIRLGMLEEHRKAGLHPTPVRNLAECWQALRERVPEVDWVRDRDLLAPIPRVDLHEARAPGVHPHVLVFRERLSSFTRGLIEDLRVIAQAPDEEIGASALTVLLVEDSVPQRAAPPNEEAPPALAEASTLNPSQCEAVEQALTAPITVVQGPPGTGKSTVVRSALLSLGVHGQTALFGSTNHRAVDAVVGPMNRWLDTGFLVADLRPSNRDKRWTSQLLANVAGAREGHELDLPALCHTLAKFEQDIQQLLLETRTVLEDGDRLLEIEQRLDTRAAELPEWVSSLDEAALPVPLTELESLIEDRQAEKPLLRRLLAAIRHWRLLRSLRASWPGPAKPPHTSLPILLEWKVDCLRRDGIEARLRDARSLEDQADNLVDLVEEKAQVVEDAVPQLPPAWAARVREEVTVLIEIRRELAGTSRSARERRGETERRHLTRLLPGLPLWTITSLSAPRAVPRVAGAFDLAIVDEAGQCNPASVLPLLFRAKRAMFVGDPQQLRPVGSLAGHKEDLLRRQHGLEGIAFSRFAFSGRSAYDLGHDALILRRGQVRLLREHYRCHPAIAEFFNEHFYDGNLLVRTSGREDGHAAAGLTWTHVPGGSQMVGSSRWHPPQVEAIVAELKALVERGFDGSVGVVTPFREHAKRIRDAAFTALGPRQADRWEFISETADGFQGGERDLILFGLVGGGEGRSATPPFYLRERNRFNVAVSRAKVQLHVFGDEDWARSCGVPVLVSLVEAAVDRTERSRDVVRTDLIGPVWEPRLAEALRREGLEFRQQYPACGYYLDFAFFLPDGKRVNVEVDGETYHRDRDGNLRAEDLRRDLVLRANGWTVKRFWVYQLREDWESCLLQIKQLISFP